MIDTFEEYTKPLVNGELVLAEVIGSLLLDHAFGRDNAKTNAWLVSQIRRDPLFASLPKRLHSATIRKLIHHLRVTSLPHLCATSKGYFIASSDEELETWSVSLRQRIRSIESIYKSAKRALRRRDLYNNDGSTKQCFIPFS